jgi:hypothetical protein
MTIYADSGIFVTELPVKLLPAITCSLGNTVPQLILMQHCTQSGSIGNLQYSFGAAALGTSHFEVSNGLFQEYEPNNGITHGGSSLETGSCCIRLRASESVDGRLIISGSGSNYFIPAVNDAFQASSTPPSISWAAFSGFENVSVGKVNITASVNGIQRVELGFQPTVVICFGLGSTSSIFNSIFPQRPFGWSNGTHQECMSGVLPNSTVQANTRHVYVTGSAHVRAQLSAGVGVVTDWSSITFDSTGFNITKNSGSSIYSMGYIAINASSSMLNTTYNINNNDVSVTGSVFTPTAVLGFSTARATAPLTTGSDHFEQMVGFATKNSSGVINQFNVWIAQISSSTIRSPFSEHNSGSFAKSKTLSFSATRGQYSLQSFESNGYTLNTDVTASADSLVINTLVFGNMIFASPMQIFGGIIYGGRIF